MYRYTWTKSVAPCLPHMPAPLSACQGQLRHAAPLAWLLCGAMVLAPLAVAFVDEYTMPVPRQVTTRDPAVVRNIILRATAGVLAVDERDGHVFAVSSGDGARRGSVSMLDATTGRLLRTSMVGVSPVAAVVAARLGRLFVANEGVAFGHGMRRGGVSALDTHSGRVVYTVRLGQANAVAVDEVTRRVFVTTLAGFCVTLDARSGRVLRYLPIGLGPSALAVDEGAGHVFVASAGAIIMLDARGGRRLRAILRGPGQEPLAVAGDPRNHHIFVASWVAVPGRSGGMIGVVTMLDARSGRVLRATLVAGVPLELAVSARTGRVVVRSVDGEMSDLDARSGLLLATFPTQAGNMAWPWRATMAVDDARRRLIVVDGGRLTLLSLTTGRVMRSISVPGDTIAIDARNGHAFVTRAGTPMVTTLNTLP